MAAAGAAVATGSGSGSKSAGHVSASAPQEHTTWTRSTDEAASRSQARPATVQARAGAAAKAKARASATAKAKAAKDAGARSAALGVLAADATPMTDYKVPAAPAPSASKTAAPSPKRAASTSASGKRAAASSVRTGGWVNPVSGARFTSGFGMRWGRLHAGDDFACAIGTPLRAMNGATVVAAGYVAGLGNRVQIRFPDGVEAVYGHMSRVAVSAGQRVAGGQIIGYSGNTGHSTGPHLHLEIHINGVPINPAGWLAARGLI